MGIRVGIIVECEDGYLKGGRGGMTAVEKDGKNPETQQLQTDQVPETITGPRYRPGFEM